MESSDQRQRTEKKSGLGSFIVKSLIAAVIVAVGIVVGMYAGTLLTSPNAPASGVIHNQSYLVEGDLFPDYELWDVNRRAELQVSDVLKDGPALLVFMNHHCTACHMMLEKWKESVIPELQRPIRVVLVYDDADPPPEDWQPYTSPTGNVLTVTTNRGDQHDEDGIEATPTLVAVGTDGRIKLVATGYQRRIDAEMLNQKF